MNNHFLISAKGMDKSFIRFKQVCPVLTGIDLNVKQGEFLAVVGPSGAGKSTLLNVLGTLAIPTAGQVLWEGQKVFELSSDDLALWRNRKIGFVFQFHHLLPEFTAMENVLMPSLICPVSPESVLQDKAAGLLKKVGLGHRLNYRPIELSGGEQQRVAIARALMNDPLALLADEPTGNLDRHTAEEVFELIEELHREKGLTVMLVTHQESFAKKAQRMVYMEDGKIV